MDLHYVPRSPLLRIPAEIRVRIVELSIGEHIFYVKPGGRLLHAIEWTYSSKASSTQSDQPYTSTTRKDLSSLTAVCRLLFHEANDILYRQTAFSFSSSQLLLDFFSQRPLALQSTQYIQLSCGPAKHSSEKLKQQNKSALNLLIRHAARLSKLHLQFGMYYGTKHDRYLFSNFWYYKLCDISRSSHFQLFLEFKGTLPGPIGNIVESEPVKQQIQKKVHCTEKNVQRLFGTQTRQEARATKTQVHRLQREITLAIHQELGFTQVTQVILA